MDEAVHCDRNDGFLFRREKRQRWKVNDNSNCDVNGDAMYGLRIAPLAVMSIWTATSKAKVVHPYFHGSRRANELMPYIHLVQGEEIIGFDDILFIENNRY